MVTIPDSVLDVAANAEHAVAGLLGQLKASDVVDQVGTAATQVGAAATHAYGAARHEVARQTAARQSGSSCRTMSTKSVTIGIVSLIGLLAMIAAWRARRADRLDRQTLRLA
jgi:hypothetical protein